MYTNKTSCISLKHLNNLLYNKLDMLISRINYNLLEYVFWKKIFPCENVYEIV